MLQITETHSMDEYIDLLSSSLKIYMEDSRLVNAYDDACFAASDYKHLALLWLKIESAGNYTSLNPDNVKDYLMSIGIDLPRRGKGKSGEVSLDMKKVIDPLIERGVAVELLTAYKDYRTYNSYANSLRKLIQLTPRQKITESGRFLDEFDTHVVEQDNLRVYYNQIAVVSVPKIFSNMITTQDDTHYIAWCDYPQADWRFAYNLFIKDEENAKIMRECTDAYEGLARMVQGDAFSLDTFKEMRKEFKVHCLKVFYNSKDGAPVPTSIREFFRKCPKYSRLLFDLSALYNFKLPICCTSYFGYEQLIPEASYADAFLSKALNTPIQTFTSHIVNETVFGVLQKFWDLGYTKDDVNIYYVRHDEPLFVFSQKILRDAWVFKECSEIYIPGFTPIHLDFHYGRYYQEEDEFLTKQINQAIEMSHHEYFMPVQSEEDYKPDSYWPFPTVESIYVQVFEEDKEYRIEFYDYRREVRLTVNVPLGCPADVAITEALEKDGLSWLGFPEYLLVRSSGFDFMDRVGPDGATLVKVINRPDTGIMLMR